MKKSYGSTIWKMLQEYAIWQPGAPVALGDFGVIRDGCFERMGNLSDYIGDVPLPTQTSMLDQLSIRSDSRVERKNGTDNKVSLSFKFRKSNGVLLSAKDMQADSFLGLQQAGRLIAAAAGWDRSWFVVTTVRHARQFFLVISKDLQAVIEGDAGAVDELMQGGAQGASAVRIQGDISLKMVGHKGPLSVRLHRLKNRGNAFKYFDDTENDGEDWILSPYLEGIPETDD